MNRALPLVISVALLFRSLVFTSCTEVPDPVTPSYKTTLAPTEIKNSAFQGFFPIHYQTYLENNDDSQMTEYGGSVPHEKHLCGDLPQAYKYCQPYLKNLWTGYPFSYEYNRARGHTDALHDVLDIDRINLYSEKTGLPSTCYNCKTTKMVEWVTEYGDDFWAKEFHQFREQVDLTDHAIGCATCHDPQTMDLRITSVPLNEALKRQDKDWRERPRAMKCELSCAPNATWNTIFRTLPSGRRPSPSFPGIWAWIRKTSTSITRTTAPPHGPGSRGISSTGHIRFPTRR